MTRLVWMYEAPDGKTVTLGEHESPGDPGGIFYVAQSSELARSWARQLGVGRIPSKEPDLEPATDASPADRIVPEPEPGLPKIEPAPTPPSPPTPSS